MENTNMFKIFVLEKSLNWRSLILDSLKDSFEIVFLPDGSDVYEHLKLNHYNVIILNLQIDDEDPFDLLRWIKSNIPYTPVIVTSNADKTELVVKVIKQGAFDFISKPFSGAKIKLAIQQVLENRSLKKEIDYLRHEQDIIYNFDQIIAFSPAMKEVINNLKKFSLTDATILMTGETGTGKSFLSGSIHFNSHRRNKPFININCSNMQETLLESELFGHEKGAFTGADKQRVGRFEQAHGGTLFLDEIGELNLSLQAKLLRVLEEKSFERVGGNKTIYSDVRVIAATNRNLKKQIDMGKFREDLYYRINVLFIKLPPLCERKQCLEPLASMLLRKICRSLQKKPVSLSPQMIEWINAYHWPGNIRQLANMLERAVILAEGPIIRKENLSFLETSESTPAQVLADTTESLEAHEKQLILKALEESLWIQKDAAGLLGISPRTLNYKISKFGISHPRWRKNR